jgi:hypothetical protein
MKTSLGIELYIPFGPNREIVAEDGPGEPAVPSLGDELTTDFVILVDGAKLVGEFDRQQEVVARRRDAAADRVVWTVEEKLGKHRDGQARVPRALERPFDGGI